jgi:hypothetical protein
MSTTTPPAPSVRSAAPIFLGGLVMMLFTGLTWWMMASRPEPLDEEAIRHAQRAEIIQKVNEQAEADLNRFAWVDEAKGMAQVPVDYAMKLEVAALRQAPSPRPAYPVDPIAAAEFLAAQKAAAEAAASAPAAPDEATAPESTEAAPTPESNPAPTP